MNKHLYINLFGSVSLLAIFFGGNIFIAQAQNQPAKNLQTQQTPTQNLQVQGLSIDPFLIEADLTPGQSSNFTITVANTTTAPLSFEVSINDFLTNGQNGQPLFLPSSEKSDPKYSISEWVKITQQPKFKIEAGQQTIINFTITPPIDGELGTHYGGLLFGQPKEILKDQSTIVQNKAGAIILGKLGKAQEQGMISRFFSQQSWYQSLPANLTLAFNNFGNVHSKPKGNVTIRNIFGQQVADIQVNRDALIVLPATEREFEVSWSPSWGFGRYVAESVMFYGNPKLEVRAQTSFWVLPLFPILMGACILLALVALGYFGIKRYNLYIINRARNENK